MKAIELPAPKPTADRQPGQPWPLAEAAGYLNVSVRTLTRAEEAAGSGSSASADWSTCRTRR